MTGARMIRVAIARNYVKQMYEETGGSNEELNLILEQLNVFLKKYCSHDFVDDVIELANNVDNPIAHHVCYCTICDEIKNQNDE